MRKLQSEESNGLTLAALIYVTWVPLTPEPKQKPCHEAGRCNRKNSSFYLVGSCHLTALSNQLLSPRNDHPQSNECKNILSHHSTPKCHAKFVVTDPSDHLVALDRRGAMIFDPSCLIERDMRYQTDDPSSPEQSAGCPRLARTDRTSSNHCRHQDVRLSRLLRHWLAPSLEGARKGASFSGQQVRLADSRLTSAPDRFQDRTTLRYQQPSGLCSGKAWKERGSIWSLSPPAMTTDRLVTSISRLYWI
jgi:hypothetical protein